MTARDPWRDVARSQAGLATHGQLAAAGVSIWAIEHRIRAERWQRLTPTVVCTTTGPLSSKQRLWLGVLHGGTGAMLGGLTAASRAGLKKWDREVITVLVPYSSAVPAKLAGFRFVRSRRGLRELRSADSGPPRMLLEPAVLLFAAADPSPRTAQGVLAAAVQQQLTTPYELLRWLGDLKPLRRAPLLRETLTDIAGGSQSVAEMDVKRLCRAHRLRAPDRQVRRRDSEGRTRFTDCEWRLADGRTLILEVDGMFHMDVDSWEDDLARQRALSSADRTLVRCTSRELRDDPARVARDLLALGVPRAA